MESFHDNNGRAEKQKEYINTHKPQQTELYRQRGLKIQAIKRSVSDRR